MVSRDRSIVKKFLDQPIESWVDGTKDFWDSPKDDWITVTYSISGIFVRDLIQESGLDRFKEFFRLTGNDSATSVPDGFKQVYGMTLHEAVTSFADSCSIDATLNLEYPTGRDPGIHQGAQSFR